MNRNLGSTTVLGAGAWGTALAVGMVAAGRDVVLWGNTRGHIDEMDRRRENHRYLPGVRLPDRLHVTADLAAALAAASRAVVLAVPSQHLRAMLPRILPHVADDPIFVNAAKGLEQSTGERLSRVIAEAAPGHAMRIVALSGPNHAEEVGRGIPTATVISGETSADVDTAQELFMTDTFRVYTNPDLVGVEMGGALKNVIALAAGISDGLGYGDNSKAALVTRGLAEMARIGARLGANPLTFSGLSGMGDLVATATSGHSRNVRAGRRIGVGESPARVLESTPFAVEGVPTAVAALRLAERFGVEMPITKLVYEVIYDSLSPAHAVGRLMGRGPKSESEALGLGLA